jgi:hypothetical protein
MEIGDGGLKTHIVDIPDEVKLLKQIAKKKGWRVNKYNIRPLHDATMFKVEVEHFVKGVSRGTKVFRTFLSDEVLKEIETLYDAIPRKIYIFHRLSTIISRFFIFLLC